MKNDDKIESTNRTINELHDYAWKYFKLHAEQRLKIFQFYIALATTIVGASVYLIRSNVSSELPAFMGVMLLFLSFVFWKLDCRTKRLVWNGEEAIKHLDSQLKLPHSNNVPHILSIIERDDYFTKGKKPKYPFFGHYNYGRCFRYIFFGFALFGLFLTLPFIFDLVNLIGGVVWISSLLCFLHSI